jgi:hypothetical protein
LSVLLVQFELIKGMEFQRKNKVVSVVAHQLKELQHRYILNNPKNREKLKHNESKLCLYLRRQTCRPFMKNLLSFILIFFTLALFFNNAVNWHYHQLPNGIVIEHAHPYQKSSSTAGSPYEHHHSDIEYLILDLIFGSVLIIVLAFYGLKLFIQFRKRILFSEPLAIPIQKPSLSPPLRGPPYAF